MVTGNVEKVMGELSLELKNKAMMYVISELKSWKFYLTKTEIFILLKYLAEFPVSKHLCYQVTTKRTTIPASIPTALYTLFNSFIFQEPVQCSNTHTHTYTTEHWNIHLERDLDFTIKVESVSALGEHMLSRSTWPLSSENDMFSIKKMNRWKLPHSSWAGQICRPNYTRHHYLQCQPEFNVHNLGDGKVSYPSEKWSKFWEIDDRRLYKFATGE